jgi:hypothetical protein
MKSSVSESIKKLPQEIYQQEAIERATEIVEGIEKESLDQDI